MCHKSLILRLAPVLLVLPFQGCSCAHNRQAVYPNRRGAVVKVNPRDGVRVRAPGVEVDVPPASEIEVEADPNSSRVPMLMP